MACLAFEEYPAANEIEHMLCVVGRPQSNEKIEQFFRTYDEQRWRFGSLDQFCEFYNQERPYMSLDWDELETPNESFDRCLPSPRLWAMEALVTGGDDGTK